MDEILARTEVDDFEMPACRSIRSACQGLEGRNFDLSIIAGRLEQAGDLDVTVTADFLQRAWEEAPVPALLAEHLDALTAFRAARNVAATAQYLHESLSATGGGNPENLIALTEEATTTMNDSLIGVGSYGWSTLGASVEDLLNKDHSGPSEFIPTGIPALDELIGGLGMGTVTTVAARPGFGKSALAMQFVRKAANAGKPSLLLSLEMGTEEVTARYLAGEARISYTNIRKGKIDEAESDILRQWSDQLQEAPVYFDTRDTVGPSELMSSFTRLNADAKMKYGEGIQMVVIDYLQLMSSARKFPSRQEEVAHYMREVTKLAKRENIAVVVVAQLNRGDKNRDVEHRPSVKDLRESGAIEQDSDVILLLAKPEDMEDLDRPRGEMEVIVGKNRNGPLGDVPVTFLAPYAAFEERDPSDDDHIDMW